MNCHDARELLSALVDGELTPDDQRQVEAHLAGCADCRKERERLGSTIVLLGQLDRPRAPVGFVDRVLEAVQPKPWYRRLLGSLFLPLSVKVPAEAAAVLLVGGLAVFVFQRTPALQDAARPQPTPQVARESEFASSAPKTTASRPADTSQPAKTPRPSVLSLPRADVMPPASSGAPSGEKIHRSRDEIAAQSELLARQKLTSRALEQTNIAPPAPSEPDTEAARKAEPPPAPAAPLPRSPTMLELSKREMESRQESTAAKQMPEQAPPPPPAPAMDQRLDAMKGRRLQAPAAAPPGASALRVLPSADVTGRLEVKDLDAAQRSLNELLAKSGGVVSSRRTDAGTVLVDVSVPKTAYDEFNVALSRIGTWQSEGRPSESADYVRITLRLVQ